MNGRARRTAARSRGRRGPARRHRPAARRCQAGRHDRDARREPSRARRRARPARRAKNGVAEPEGDRAADDGQLAGRAGCRPTPPPARPACRCARRSLAGAALRRPAGHGLDGRPRRVGLEAAAAAAHARPAVGLDDDVADVAGVADAPSSSRPSRTMPPPTPVATTMPMKSSTPDRAPAPALGRAPGPWRRCRRRSAAAVSSASSAASGNRRPRRDVKRRHRARRRDHRPAATRRHRPPASAGAAATTRRISRRQRRPHVALAGSATGRGRATSPASSTTARRQLGAADVDGEVADRSRHAPRP